MDGAGLVLAAWSLQRMREVQHAREVFDAICDEQLPLSTRRSMRERGTA
jgi:hypothetical protein